MLALNLNDNVQIFIELYTILEIIISVYYCYCFSEWQCKCLIDTVNSLFGSTNAIPKSFLSYIVLTLKKGIYALQERRIFPSLYILFLFLNNQLFH